MGGAGGAPPENSSADIVIARLIFFGHGTSEATRPACVVVLRPSWLRNRRRFFSTCARLGCDYGRGDFRFFDKRGVQSWVESSNRRSEMNSTSAPTNLHAVAQVDAGVDNVVEEVCIHQQNLRRRLRRVADEGTKVKICPFFPAFLLSNMNRKGWVRSFRGGGGNQQSRSETGENGRGKERFGVVPTDARNSILPNHT